MKKSLLALAVLGAFAGAASAQSSVTLSGMFDLAVQHTGTATGYQWGQAAAGSAFDNITIAGREDLGDGMYSFVYMNLRFRGNNGTINSADYGTQTGAASQPGLFRQDWVGIGSNTLGQVRLGRMLMPLEDLDGNFDIWYGGYTVASTHTGGITATIRANNAISYRSPSIGGLVIDAAIAAGKGQIQFETQNDYSSSAPLPGNPGGYGHRPEGFSANYKAGPLWLGAAYDINYANYKTTGVYGQYNFGAFTLNSQYETGDSNNAAGTRLEKIKAFSVSADVYFGANTVKVGYLNYNSSVNVCGQAGKQSCDAHKLGLGDEYAFSKKTLIYTDIAKSTGARLNTSTGATGAAAKAVFDLGLRVKF